MGQCVESNVGHGETWVLVLEKLNLEFCFRLRLNFRWLGEIEKETLNMKTAEIELFIIWEIILILRSE